MFAADDVKYAASMKVLGWMLIVLSIVLFGVSTAVYEFLQGLHIGGYWGGILTFIVGILGATSRNRCFVVIGIIISIVAIIVAVIAAVYTMVAGIVFMYEIGCYNTQTSQSWGTEEGKSDAMICASNDTGSFHYGDSGINLYARGQPGVDLLHYNYNYNIPNNTNTNFFYNHPDWIYYYNVNHYQNWYATHYVYYWDRTNGDDHFTYSLANTQCVCTDNFWCYGYTLGKGDDCGSILTTYPNMLIACSALLYLLSFLTFIYSICACCSACRSSAMILTVISTVEPVQIQMAGTAMVYVQPGGQQTAVASQYVAQYAPLASVEGEAVAVGDDKYN